MFKLPSEKGMELNQRHMWVQHIALPPELPPRIIINITGRIEKTKCFLKKERETLSLLFFIFFIHPQIFHFIPVGEFIEYLPD